LFTLGGGEQTYNLGQFQICADWVAGTRKLVKQIMETQIKFYTTLAKQELVLCLNPKVN
jgi:hypothetical protein